MGSSSQKTTKSEQQGPWGPATEAVQGMIPQVQGMESTLAGWQPYGNYTGPSVAGFTPAQLQAMGLTSGVATGGGSSVGEANALNRYTLGGGFLSAGNPYFQGMENTVAQSVLPQLDAQWSRAGRFNSPNAEQDIGKGLTAAMMPYAFQNYSQERGNMMNAQGMAAGLDQAQYIDPSMLMGVGSEQQQMNAQQIQDQIYRALYAQGQPEQALQTTLGQLEGLGKMGSTDNSTSTTTSTPSPLQMGMGAGMMGLGMMTGMPMLGMGGLMGGMGGFGSMMLPMGAGTYGSFPYSGVRQY